MLIRRRVVASRSLSLTVSLNIIMKIPPHLLWWTLCETGEGPLIDIVRCVDWCKVCSLQKGFRNDRNTKLASLFDVMARVCQRSFGGSWDDHEAPTFQAIIELACGNRDHDSWRIVTDNRKVRHRSQLRTYQWEKNSWGSLAYVGISIRSHAGDESDGPGSLKA